MAGLRLEMETALSASLDVLVLRLSLCPFVRPDRGLCNADRPAAGPCAGRRAAPGPGRARAGGARGAACAGAGRLCARRECTRWRMAYADLRWLQQVPASVAWRTKRGSGEA